MIEVALTEDELALLDWFFEICWDSESLAALRTMARDDAQLIRLRAAVVSLLRKGLVEVHQTSDSNPQEQRPLSSADAESALAEDRSWARPGEANFHPESHYYRVVPKLVHPEEEDEAIPAYAAALRESGKEPGSIGGIR